MVCSGGAGNAPGSFMSIGAPDTTTRASGPDRRGVALIVRLGVQGVGAGGTRLHQNIGALAGRDQQLLERLHGAELDAVIGDRMQVVLLQIEQHVVLIGRIEDAPALHLAGTHLDHRSALAVDRQEARRRLRKQRLEILDHAVRVVDHLGQHQQALAGGCDLRHIGEIALDDDGAHHAARHLDIGAAVVVRVIPVGALGVILRQLDLDIVAVAGRHRAHDVVGDAARARMRAMEMEIGVVELMRLADVGGHPVPVRRQIVDQLDAQRVAGLHAQGRPRAAAFIGPDIEPDAADLAVGVGRHARSC